LEDAILDATHSHADLAEADLLRRAIADRTCPTCHTSLDDAHWTRIGERLEELHGGDGYVDSERLLEMQVEARSLRLFADSGPVREYALKATEIRRLRIEANRNTRRSESIRDNLRGHDAAEISSLEHRYDDVVERLSRASEQLQDVSRRKDDTQTELRRAETQIRRLSTSDPRLAVEVSALEAITRMFDIAIDGFRDRLRTNVERDATEIFRHLTTASDLDYLRINSQYGLRIIDNTGREITTRSAGAEQVVALSLIGALNWCAVREGPIVMDTPFGRLDRNHRQNILQYVPHLGPQVILLVQSGEFERERDRGLLGTAIAREYEIRHVDGLSTQSEVVPIG
jgi:DNA sulfur modification protein DndD